MATADDGGTACGESRRSRRSIGIEWVAIALLAGVVIIGCTQATTPASNTPAPSSSQISGELGTTVNRVVGGLDDKQKDCIEKTTGGPAAAASNCVDRTVLAQQVVDQLKAMGITEEPVLTCIQKAVEGLSNADLEKLAGGASEDAMQKLGGDITSCMGATRPTAVTKFSSVASAIS
jgi:hypothetical protein